MSPFIEITTERTIERTVISFIVLGNDVSLICFGVKSRGEKKHRPIKGRSHRRIEKGLEDAMLPRRDACYLVLGASSGPS